MFDRLISLINEDNFNKLKNLKVLLIGIGGVGGYTLEALVRCGILDITVVDYDTIDESNINRQILTSTLNIGEYKVSEAYKRYKSINPNVKLTIIKEKIDENNIINIIDNNYDYIIDACDTVIVKFLLMKWRDTYKYKLISSMGTAKKIDPTKLEITTIDKTSYDKLAKKLRLMLRKNNIRGKFYVVSSREECINTGNTLASIVTVPAVAGLYLASYVINDVLK